MGADWRETGNLAESRLPLSSIGLLLQGIYEEQIKKAVANLLPRNSPDILIIWIS